MTTRAMLRQGLLQGQEAEWAVIRDLLRGTPPPGIIFAPRRTPAVLLRLHTANQIRRPSLVQEQQCTATALDGTRIMWFSILE